MNINGNKQLPGLKIRNIEVPVPVIQGGMGVRVSANSLASAVSNHGGIGTIASVGLGNPELYAKDYVKGSSDSLALEIRSAKAKTSGPVAVNVMVALSNYEPLVRTAVDEGADIIVSGAGLPLSLPHYVGDSDIALVPIVSSGRAANMIFRSWTRKTSRVPDAFVVEGPLAGGHLGFSCEADIASSENRVERVVADVVRVVEQFAADTSTDPVPVIAAGGIFQRSDVDRMIEAGASGVQVATPFVCTAECAVDDAFKRVYIEATESDVVLFMSPAGMLARAIKTPLLEKVLDGEKIKFPCMYKCLRTCAGLKAPFCIARALIYARNGNIEEGLVFAGSNVDRITETTTVKAVFDKLTNGTDAKNSQDNTAGKETNGQIDFALTEQD